MTFGREVREKARLELQPLRGRLTAIVGSGAVQRSSLAQMLSSYVRDMSSIMDFTALASAMITNVLPECSPRGVHESLLTTLRGWNLLHQGLLEVLRWSTQADAPWRDPGEQLPEADVAQVSALLQQADELLRVGEEPFVLRQPGLWDLPVQQKHHEQADLDPGEVLRVARLSLDAVLSSMVVPPLFN